MASGLGLAATAGLGMANSIGNTLGGIVRDSTRLAAQGIMGHNANAVSAAAQGAAANFNSNQSAIANELGTNRLAEQYAFNSGQAQISNDFTSAMWDKAAAWNAEQMRIAMEYNSAEAQKQREWQEQMRATQYQTAVADMEKAGLNPILAATSGLSAGVPTGSAGTISASSMSGAQGNMASGSAFNGSQGSISGYTGQLEYMGGMLGLLSGAMGGLSSAIGAIGKMANTAGGGTAAEFALGLIDKILDKKGQGSKTHESSSGSTHGGSHGRFGGKLPGNFLYKDNDMTR